jgi:nitroimidazol reductase NimA-like FMN-containing flavoprotein (pyridoxamine 5'-phosphate oxidase superfamily)
VGQMTMSIEEREAFLADVHVAVLVVERDAGEPPLVTPVWYRYSPGGPIEMMSTPVTEKIRRLKAAVRATVIVQREEPPFAYVTVDCSVAFGTATDEVKTDIAARYVGTEGAQGFLAARPDVTVLVQLTPERWHTTDLAKA